MPGAPADRFEDSQEFFGRREGSGTIIQAIAQVLSDGKARKAKAIVQDAVAAKLLPANTFANALSVDLRTYIFRALATGRSPLIVEDSRTHEFRLNRPVDDWPKTALRERPRYTSAATIEATEQRLRVTSVGKDSAAFEVAVCDAFALFGFITTHMGGLSAPDGRLDAPLGPLAYSVVLECKSTPSASIVRNAQPEEPAKFCDVLGAQYAVLVGPDFEDTQHLRDELLTHKVSLWTIDDVVTALRNDVDAHECRDLFAPGAVRDRLVALEWERGHGCEKRALVIQDILRREGYAEQCRLVRHIAPDDAPVPTLDAAMILVEEALGKLNVRTVATRDEVRTAMHDLLRAGEAVTVPDREGIVITRGRSG